MMRMVCMVFCVLSLLLVVNVLQVSAWSCVREWCAPDCEIPPMPPLSKLLPNPYLPDPFMFMNGTRVSTQAQWACRRAEIAIQLQHYELGEKPPAPDITDGMVNETMVTVTNTLGSNSIMWSVNVTLPPVGRAPYPLLIVLIGGTGPPDLNITAIQARGIAIIQYNNSIIGNHLGLESRGKGLFYDLYGSNHSAGALIAWAWGTSRLLDVIETRGQRLFDVERIGITGCSRNGKGSLVSGAFDMRIALVLPQESGSGGAASWRISDWQGAPTVQTLGEIVGENVWFTPSLVQFSNASDLLPYDHHALEGMVAPRGLLIIENASTVWGGNISCWGNSLAGHMIYEALGIPDRMGVSQDLGHPHCHFLPTQQPDVDAYIVKFLLHQPSNTSILYTNASYTFDKAKWINWTVPNLPPLTMRSTFHSQ